MLRQPVLLYQNKPYTLLGEEAPKPQPLSRLNDSWQVHVKGTLVCVCLSPRWKHMHVSLWLYEGKLVSFINDFYFPIYSKIRLSYTVWEIREHVVSSDGRIASSILIAHMCIWKTKGRRLPMEEERNRDNPIKLSGWWMHLNHQYLLPTQVPSIPMYKCSKWVPFFFWSN